MSSYLITWENPLLTLWVEKIWSWTPLKNWTFSLCWWTLKYSCESSFIGLPWGHSCWTVSWRSWCFCFSQCPVILCWWWGFLRSWCCKLGPGNWRSRSTPRIWLIWSWPGRCPQNRLSTLSWCSNSNPRHTANTQGHSQCPGWSSSCSRR